MKKTIVFVIGLLVLASCSNFSEEDLRIHNEKIEVGKALKKDKLNEMVQVLNEDLQNCHNELNKINEWQFGRLQSEKEEQLETHYEKIRLIEHQISKLKEEISMSNLFNSFEFQVSPEGTIAHIFLSAKTGDFSKMRHLLDPYGEYDSDAFGICLVDIYPQEDQKEWMDQFKNGRIISEAKVIENEAEIEIAFGNFSDQLGTINLIRRLDRWYISHF